MTNGNDCDVVRLEAQTIPFGFRDLAAGLLFRYPNPLAKHVQCYDVIEPFSVNTEGELTGKSIVMKTNPIPKLFHSLCENIGVQYKNKTCIPLVEEYTTNLATKTVKHLSRNIMSRNYLITHEKSVYTPQTATTITGGCIVPDDLSNSSTMIVNKQLAVRTDASRYAVIRQKCLQYTVNRWKKQAWKQKNGLCFSLAKDNYCPELAKDFQYAGQAGEKWVRAVARLRELQASARNLAQNASTEITNPSNIRKAIRKAPKF